MTNLTRFETLAKNTFFKEILAGSQKFVQSWRKLIVYFSELLNIIEKIKPERTMFASVIRFIVR